MSDLSGMVAAPQQGTGLSDHLIAVRQRVDQHGCHPGAMGTYNDTRRLELDYVNDAAHEDESLNHFTIGRLELRSDSGDTLKLEAGNGDERTATVSLSSPGLSTQFTQRWSVWRDNLLPVADTPPVYQY